MVPQQSHRSLIHQDQIRPSKRSTVLYDQYQPYEVPKAMGEKNFVSQDTLARHKEKSDKPIFQEKDKVSPILDKCVYKSSPTGMSHLSLSKNVKTGGTNESYMLTEVPRKEPDHKLSHEPPHKWKPKIELSIVQMQRLKVCLSDLKTPKTLDYPGIMHLSLPKSFDPGIRQEEVHTNQGKQLQERRPSNQISPKKNIILHHADAHKNVEKILSCKEESFKEIPQDNLLLRGGSTQRWSEPSLLGV
ncbi:hypothetical protein F2Q69_00031192 [Brassica cretica]|uniref:Uncharacterized protein n=1 Tax=Brassica cretica TaxID=69181 RepID=A0A8S9S2E9_BRACR|nr:hypothetical protein F2Q69_00031192 [Brassica cretica]